MPALSNLVNRRIAEFVMNRQALFHQPDSTGYEESMTPFTNKLAVFFFCGLRQERAMLSLLLHPLPERPLAPS
jgi:hypothetical protein